MKDMRSRIFGASVVACSLVAGAVFAQGGAGDARGFDPRQPCGDILSKATDVDKMMVAAWVFGYLAGSDGNLRPVDFENNKVVLRNVINACTKDQNRSLLALVGKHRQGGVDDPGSEANARRLLMRFLEPGAELAALTAALKPSEADIRAVYAPPLADRLVSMYAQMFGPGVKIGPKPGQTAVLTSRGTTGGLKGGDAVLRDFPGGYKKVLPYFIGDQPIIRFKFVKQGDSAGMAFDGLVFVNAHWVLMPKPWRALD